MLGKAAVRPVRSAAPRSAVDRSDCTLTRNSRGHQGRLERTGVTSPSPVGEPPSVVLYRAPAPTMLRTIAIEGLFGLYDHTIELREEPPLTIVAGPNGIGKTTLLRLTDALLRGSYRTLSEATFSRLAVTHNSGAVITAEPILHDADAFEVRLTLARSGARRHTTTIGFDPNLPALPPYIQRVGPDEFVDTRDGEELDQLTLFDRFGGEHEELSPPDWFDAADWATDFIETRRLDVLNDARLRRYPQRRPRRRRRAPIYDYLDAVAGDLERARAESARIRQARDRTLAQRLLTRAGRSTVNVDQLRERYAAAEQRASELTANGLLSESLEVLPREDMNPTEKRVLNLFLDDFEAKLVPLERQSARLNHLRSMIDRKFLNKTLEISSRDGLTFRTAPANDVVPAESLSSGEQHQLALVCRLLFTERDGAVVLIDEPELSLHVSWQHEMIADLTEIARLTDISFVLATHSTAIINGRWELVEELGPIDDRLARA